MDEQYWIRSYPTYPDGEDQPCIPVYEVLSESEILADYWGYWFERMCKKFGQDVVDAQYSAQDCIENWVVINWAWRVEETPSWDRCKLPVTELTLQCGLYPNSQQQESN